MAPRAALIGICVLSFASSLVDSNECLVRTYAQLTDAANVGILSFIKLNGHLDFVLEFEELDSTYWRDWVELANSEMTRSMVRDGLSNGTKEDLPLVIPEGWTSLRLQAVNKLFRLTLVTDNDDMTTLIDLTLDYPVSSLHVQGNFSLCDGGSPEWEVSDGREVPVPLQPRHNQTLQVTCRGHAAPYIVRRSAQPRYKDLKANASLSIVTTYTYLEVSQEDEKQLEENDSIASPSVVLGSRGGNLHLRLVLSPALPATQHPTIDSRVAPCGDSAATLWLPGCLLFFGGVVFGCLTGIISLVLIKQRPRKDTISRRKKLETDTVSEEEKCFGA